MSDFQLQWNSAYNEYNSLFAQAEKDFNELVSNFASQEKSFYSKNQIPSCQWLGEVRYFNSIKQLHKTLIGTCILIKGIWESFKELEANRINSIKSSVEEFLNLHSDIFKQNIEEIGMIINEFSFQDEDIFTVLGDEKELFYDTFGGQDFFKGLIEWPMPTPPESKLIIKAGMIEQEAGVFKMWKPGYAVLTIDNFLHIFDQDVSLEFQEPSCSCFLQGASVVENEELYFELIHYKSKGIFRKFSAPKRSVFKFNTLQEFLAWVKTIKDSIIP